jgi:modification methylase
MTPYTCSSTARSYFRAAQAPVPLSVWACGQRPAVWQRRGRYLPATTSHPVKMLPSLAATAIISYTQPEELVLDPMCGIGTTLVEAIHLDRTAIGIECEPRWANLARANLDLAREHGAAGRGAVIPGDAASCAAPAAASGGAGGTGVPR